MVVVVCTAAGVAEVGTVAAVFGSSWELVECTAVWEQVFEAGRSLMVQVEALEVEAS